MNLSIVLKFIFMTLTLFGMMGTSCVKTGGIIYKDYILNKCPPKEYKLPLWARLDGNLAEIHTNDVYDCSLLSSYQYFQSNKRNSPLYYSTIIQRKSSCYLVVGFDAQFSGGLYADKDIIDLTKAYTYQMGVDHIDNFAKTLISGTIMTPIKPSKLKELKPADYKKGWCKLLKSQSY